MRNFIFLSHDGQVKQPQKRHFHCNNVQLNCLYCFTIWLFALPCQSRMFSPELTARAKTLITRCTERNLMLATAESCTGGLVAALLTSIAGSSAVFERGFVTYSNRAKQESLGVDPAILLSHGAVSAETARAMTEGTLRHAPAQIAVAVTGIAGPGGGSPEKPVGLVYFGCGTARDGKISALRVEERRFGDIGRDAVRLAAVAVALELLSEAAG